MKQAWERRLLLGAARRVKHHSIAMGFGGWQEHWERQAWQRRTLAKAVSRLARPQLAAAMATWVCDWRAAEKVRAAAEASLLRAAVRTAQEETTRVANQAADSEAALRRQSLGEVADVTRAAETAAAAGGGCGR